MKKLNLILTIILLTPLLLLFSFRNTKDSRYYEMRIYYANPGKLEDLQRRFREHTARIFEKHGMTNIGYWIPLENLDNKLIYILSYPSKEAREKSWKSFSEDPEWRKVQSLSEANGKLVTKVVSTFLTATDFSPEIKPYSSGKSRIFELRVYKTPDGKLDDLLERFRNFTMTLFSKHGMTNIGYWLPVEKAQGSENTLVYILAHESLEKGEAAWKAFREDPEWIKVKKASESKGPLTQKVESTFMVPTDYSPIK